MNGEAGNGLPFARGLCFAGRFVILSKSLFWDKNSEGM